VVLLTLATAAIPLALLAAPAILAAPAALVALRGLYECGNASYILELALRDAQSEAHRRVALELVPAEAAR